MAACFPVLVWEDTLKYTAAEHAESFSKRNNYDAGLFTGYTDHPFIWTHKKRHGFECIDHSALITMP